MLKIWQLYKNLKLVRAGLKYPIAMAQSQARKAFQIMATCSNAFFFFNLWAAYNLQFHRNLLNKCGRDQLPAFQNPNLCSSVSWYAICPMTGFQKSEKTVFADECYPCIWCEFHSQQIFGNVEVGFSISSVHRKAQSHGLQHSVRKKSQQCNGGRLSHLSHALWRTGKQLRNRLLT